jgi:lysophospholipase L1-like esterase
VSSEASLQRWSSGYDGLLARLQKTPGVHALDLMQRLYAQGVMNERNFFEFYWPVDGHFNPKGYEAMGIAVADAILELGLLDRAPR